MAYADQSNRPKTKTIMANLIQQPQRKKSDVTVEPIIYCYHHTLDHFYIEQINFEHLNETVFFAWGQHKNICLRDNTVALFIVTPKPKLPAGTPTDDEGQERRGTR